MAAYEAEPMINAHQAAAALGLPAYWFADPKQRAKYRIPHYRLVGRVRFRLSELTAWSARSASTTAPRREVTP
jgi:hypothetical protein